MGAGEGGEDGESAKIWTAVPEELKPVVEDKWFTAKLPWNAPKPKVDLAVIRRAVKEKAKLEIDYKAANGRRTRRVVNPMELRLYPPWVLIAWCETRENVRMFRVDRVRKLSTPGAG